MILPNAQNNPGGYQLLSSFFKKRRQGLREFEDQSSQNKSVWSWDSKKAYLPPKSLLLFKLLTNVCDFYIYVL